MRELELVDTHGLSELLVSLDLGSGEVDFWLDNKCDVVRISLNREKVGLLIKYLEECSWELEADSET